MTFTLATLDTLPRLLPNHEFDLDQLLLHAPVLAPEQRELRQRGFLSEDTSLRVGYTPRGDLMIWFLAEELTRLLRPSNVDVARWLTEQQWDGMLKKGQKEAIGNVLLSIEANSGIWNSQLDQGVCRMVYTRDWKVSMQRRLYGCQDSTAEQKYFANLCVITY
jgi:hypothetical protein